MPVAVRTRTRLGSSRKPPAAGMLVAPGIRADHETFPLEGSSATSVAPSKRCVPMVDVVEVDVGNRMKMFVESRDNWGIVEVFI